MEDCRLTNTQQPYYFLCSFSDPSTGPLLPESVQNKQNKGLDRLRKSGFNTEEIAIIRERFHRSHGTDYNGYVTEDILRTEEQLMQNTGDIFLDDTMNEILCGFVLGFFLGIFSLFWIRDPVFSQRHQLGIFSGMFLHIIFGIRHIYF
ncbi:hypothetical protein BDF14DRAFT_1771008 [Spinellus fusiger]|nr:hypothetical protein BDF14DRAFT_1771008 [Spinellus fusiger]